MTPDDTELWFIPLGGCGEIGMNMNLYGHDDSWLMVDCGVTFAKQADVHSAGHRQVQMADPAFIEERRQQLDGIIITHAHEDHLGGLPWLWKQLQCPVYATTFTAAMLRRKLIEHNLVDKVPVRVVETGDRITIGRFVVEWVSNTHSIPEPCGLSIETPVGRVFHTADWKLDNDPVVGATYARERYQQFAEQSVTAMVCDSTCAINLQPTPSEADLYLGIKSLVDHAPGRVVVACFGSNIARLTTLARVAHETGRHLGILGRSLINTVSVARSTGYWDHNSTLVDQQHLGYLPAETLLLVATGSQGEPRTALHRLSINAFRDLQLEPADTVIFSARKIPGNESEIDALIERLRAMQVTVITPDDTEQLIHTSGHPSASELKQMYHWVQPEICIPVHGEREHMDAHKEVARDAGVERQLCGENGDLFFLAPTKGIRRQAVDTGRVGVERGRVVRLE